MKKELGKLVGLNEDASYPEIVEAYLSIVNNYLSNLEGGNNLSQIQPVLASNDPRKLVH